MSNDNVEESSAGPYLEILNFIAEYYYAPLDKYLQQHPQLIKTFPAFLLEQEHLAVYIGKTHLGIEYFGKETTDDLPKNKKVAISYYDYSNLDESLFEEIVGFKYDSTIKDFRMPLPPYSEDLLLPTNKGMDELLRLKWNFAAQDSIMGINSPCYSILPGQFTRIINGRFYDADENGLKTRHIKWIDFLPLSITDNEDGSEQLQINIGTLKKLIEHDAHYRYPQPESSNYKYFKLPRINRFIELIGTKNSSETTITSFLENPENQFILTMGLFAIKIFSQVACEWQSEQHPAIKPDFFIVKPNGFADIVEFKLPNLKTTTVVGRVNRETFSAELSSYISQTRVYSRYFEDPNNRRWVEQRYGIKVLYPRRILVAGRRWDFSSEEWRSIQADYRDIEILSYEDLIDGVVAQFYM